MELARKVMGQPHRRLRSLSFSDSVGASQLALISPELSNRIKAVGGMVEKRRETMSDSSTGYSTRMGLTWESP